MAQGPVSAIAITAETHRVKESGGACIYTNAAAATNTSITVQLLPNDQSQTLTI